MYPRQPANVVDPDSRTEGHPLPGNPTKVAVNVRNLLIRMCWQWLGLNRHKLFLFVGPEFPEGVQWFGKTPSIVKTVKHSKTGKRCALLLSTCSSSGSFCSERIGRTASLGCSLRKLAAMCCPDVGITS